LDTDITDLFKQRAGQDITNPLASVFDKMDPKVRAQNIACLKNVFFVGQADFRKTAKCQAQNYLLIIASGILMGSMGLKCRALSCYHGPISK
jgi:chitin synthase